MTPEAPELRRAIDNALAESVRRFVGDMVYAITSRCRTRLREEELVVSSLVIPFAVVVLDELADRAVPA